jgi:hypothetical protein
MALQMNYYDSLREKLIYNAYWRINPNHGIEGGKNNIIYTIEVFESADLAHAKNFKCIKGFSHSFVPDISIGAPNILIQAYKHAKANFYGESVDV